MKRKYLSMAVGLALLAPATFVQAQEQQPAAAGHQATTLDSIKVTARKREESLQSAPLSVAAFSGDALEKAGVDEFSEIASRVPGWVTQIPPVAGDSLREGALLVQMVARESTLAVEELKPSRVLMMESTPPAPHTLP